MEMEMEDGDGEPIRIGKGRKERIGFEGERAWVIIRCWRLKSRKGWAGWLGLLPLHAWAVGKLADFWAGGERRRRRRKGGGGVVLSWLKEKKMGEGGVETREGFSFF